MTADADPRDELRASVEGLSERQAELMLAWMRVVRQERGAPREEQSVGPLVDLLGIVSEAGEPGRARLRLTIDPAWHNPNGVLHGGVIYTMVDTGMGTAVSSALAEGESCATIDVNIRYLTSVRQGTLVAEAEVMKLGRNIAFTEAKVTDDRGRLVATASGSMFIIRPGSQE